MGNPISLLIFVCASILGWKIFSRLRVPAAPVLGGMVAVALANILSLPLQLPSWLRLIMSINLGISIGSRFHIRLNRNFTLSAIGFILVVVLGSLGIGFSVWAMGMEFQTALFASLLGGLTEITFIAQEFSFDSFQVTLFQTVRMCMLLVFIPVIARRMPESAGNVRTKDTKVPAPSRKEWVVLIALALLCGWSLGKLHVPAGKMLGAAAATAVFSRVRHVRPRLNPKWHSGMLSLIGGSIGLNVTVASILAIPSLIVPMVVYLLLIALVVLITYLLFRKLAGMDMRTALFSATMGGLSPSIAMADSMGADSSTVSSFQVIRYFSVIILALVLGNLI